MRFAAPSSLDVSTNIFQATAMTPTLLLLATVNGSPARKGGAFRSRLPMALACFTAAIVFATVAAASTPLMSWMDQSTDEMASLRVQP